MERNRGKRERKGRGEKGRKVEMRNEESRRRMETAERKAPSSGWGSTKRRKSGTKTSKNLKPKDFAAGLRGRERERERSRKFL